MPQNVARNKSRFPVAIVAALFSVVCFSGAQAGDYKHYRHDYPYRYDYTEDRHRLRQDVTRLRGQMRNQQRQLKEQLRLQQEQTRLLRQQASAQHQVTAMQACYYRFEAGLDLCEDLFDAASKEYVACRAKVVEKNPGCAGDIASPALKSGN